MSTSSCESGCCKKCKHNVHRNTSQKAASGKTEEITGQIFILWLSENLGNENDWKVNSTILVTTYHLNPRENGRYFESCWHLLRGKQLVRTKIFFYYLISVLLKTTSVLTWSNITWPTEYLLHGMCILKHLVVFFNTKFTEMFSQQILEHGTSQLQNVAVTWTSSAPAATKHCFTKRLWHSEYNQ
jgi:hypothetical protein